MLVVPTMMMIIISGDGDDDHDHDDDDDEVNCSPAAKGLAQTAIDFVSSK